MSSAINLTETQRSVLVALNFKPATAFAMAHTMKLDKALVLNLLNQLVAVGVAKKHDNSQYAVTGIGKTYLRTTPAAASKTIEPVAELIDVDRPNEKPAEDLAALLDMTPAVEPKPDPVVVRAEAETTAIVTQLQPSKPALPTDIESSLLKLEKLLHVPAIKPLPDIDTKLQVLERLAALLHPTIADVLDAIADDLQRVQQVAVDVSKAA